MSFDSRAVGPEQSDSVPVIRYDERRAHYAWEAHRAMIRAELRDPALKNNVEWAALREAACANFIMAFEGVGQ
jgi:hypothetical protein